MKFNLIVAFIISFTLSAISQNCGFTISDSSSAISCYGECDGIASVSVSGGNSPYSYIWSNGETSNVIINLCKGTYIVTITDNLGCDSVKTVQEITNPSEIIINLEKTDINCGILASVNANPQGGYKPYKYLFTDYEDSLDSPEFNELESGNYTLTVVDNKGCVIDTTFEIIELEECLEPLPVEAFTPNGDGIGETWTIRNTGYFPNCRITVFDRWGQRVYRSIGYETPWDGHGIFGTLPAATYYYVIELDQEDKNAGVVKGRVALVR